jgi:TRAP-type C4-dicarboxylate transport system substrate-binding protein
MKKLVSAMIIMLLALTVVTGCGEEATTTTASVATTATTATQTTAATAGSQTTAATAPVTTAEASAEVIKLAMGTGLPPTHPMEIMFQEWIKKIEADTGGRVKIEYYPAGELISQFGAYDELTSKVADIANVNVVFPGSPFVIAQALQVFLYGASFEDSRLIYQDLAAKYPEINAEYDGMHRLFGYGSPEMGIHSKEPIRTLADLNGKQIMPPPSFPMLMDMLGATGTMLDMTEVYPQLDKGIISGAVLPTEILLSMNLKDVTKYTTFLPVPVPPVIAIGMNKDSWDGLPADIQQIFTDSAAWAETQLDKTLSATQAKTIEAAKAGGHEFIELPQADLDILFGLLDQISKSAAAELDKQGLPGSQIYADARALVATYGGQ